MKNAMVLGVICLLLLAASAFANSGGPDNYGNIWKDNLEPGGPTFNYIDIINTGTRLGNGDDAVFPVHFGFSFPFYGAQYDSFWVSTNGLITLTEPNPSRFNDCPIPFGGVADYWIGPFWDDLNMRNADSARIFFQYYDATVDYVVIQWHRFSKYGLYTDPMNMEAILYADGKIIFQYNYINALANGQGQQASIGIEKNSTDGLSYLCNDDYPIRELYSGLAIGFYPPVINHDISVNSIEDPTYKLIVVGGPVLVRATLQNKGLMSDNFNAYLDIINSSGTTVFRDTCGMSLAPNAAGLAIFSSWTISVADSLTLVVTSGLATDQIPDNNSLRSYIKSMTAVSLPLVQDFEGPWPTAGWNVIDQSGDSSTWTASTIRARSPIHAGQACYDAWGAPDDWLVLPPLNLSGSTGVKWDYFEEQSHWANNGLRHTLYVSTGIYFDPATAIPLAVQTPSNHAIHGFSGDPESVEISDYAGNSHVWLAYRYEQNSGANWDSLDYVMEYWWIDDINIYEIVLADVGTHSIESPEGFVRTRCSSPVEVTVKNFGSRPQVFSVNVTITGNHYGVVYNNTVSGVSLAPDSSQLVTFPMYTNALTDTYTMVATTLLPGDELPSNNTVSKTFYVSRNIEHIYDDNDTTRDDCLIASPFNNSMLAVRFTPLDVDFTILGGNIYVPRYNEDPNGYAEYEWVKFCPDLGGAPDLDHPYATIEHVGTYEVPALIPLDIPDIPVYNYAGDVWMVAKYFDNSLYFLCTGSDIDRPQGRSYYNTQGNPPVWTQDANLNYMMRLDMQYLPCPGEHPDIRISQPAIVDTVLTRAFSRDTLYISNLGQMELQYGLHSNRPWITVSPDTGAVLTLARDTIIINLDAATLPPGEYSGNISLNSNDTDRPLLNIPVNLVVISGPNADISLSQNAFSEVIRTGNSVTDTLFASNIGNSMVYYALHNNQTWLSVYPDTGEIQVFDSDTLLITLDAHRAPGEYADTITVTSNDPDQPLITLPVHMRVNRNPGISGIVYNNDNVTPLSNVIITTHNALEIVVAVDTSNAGGMWDLDLIPGTYHEHLTKTGYVDGLISDIVITTDVANVSYNLLLLATGCHYTVGDINGTDILNGVDVVFAVAYFKGGRVPPYTCECPAGSGVTWYVAGDVNASCNFNGVDVTYMVSYFKGGPFPHPCADCLPTALDGPLAKPGKASSSDTQDAQEKGQ